MKKNTLVVLLMFLFIMFSGSQALAKSNNPPKISSFTASYTSVKAQEKIKLTVVAKDADKDKLTYQWSQTNNSEEKGVFSGSGTSVYWTAPRVSEEKRIVLQVKVLDSKKAAATKSITLTVAPKSMTQLYEELKESVVSIKTDKGQGTGFVYAKDGSSATIATNFHVIRGAKKVEVTLSNGKTYSSVLFEYQDCLSDWALFSISASNLKPISIQQQLPKIGEEVFTIGNPQGLGWSMSSGIISDNARDIIGQKYLQTTTPVNPGNSGGPLFNRKGEVIGVVSAQYNNTQNINFAIPITKIKTSLEASVFMPFDDFFSEGYIEGKIEELADRFNKDKKLSSIEFGDKKIENITYANGSWEDDEKELVYGLDVAVSYEDFLKIYKLYKEDNEEFAEKFIERNLFLIGGLYNYTGVEPVDLYYVIEDSLDTPPPTSIIPSEFVKFENGKYKIYMEFYYATLSSTSIEDNWIKIDM